MQNRFSRNRRSQNRVIQLHQQPQLLTARPASRGFTLIEVLVVLTISAILIAIAVPSFEGTISRSRLRDAAQTLHASLQLARSEAIRRATPVTICRVTNPNAALPLCNNAAAGGVPAGDWGSGWVVFAEEAPAGTVGVADAGDTVIQVQDPVGVGNARRAELIHPAAGGVITFSPVGLRTGGGAPELTFNVNYPQAALGAMERQLQVVLSLVGQIRVVGTGG